MDLSRLIDFYDKEQKTLFTAICISMPMVFSILYFYIPDFKGFDTIIQIIFSLTASLLCTFCSFMAILFSIIVVGVKRKVRLFQLIVPISITCVLSILCYPHLHDLGILIPVLFFINGVIALFAAIRISLKFVQEDNNRNRKKKKRKKPTKKNA